MQQNSSLSLAGKGLKSLNEEFFQNPQSIIHLDLSMNQFKTGKDLGKFPNMKTLILDCNFIQTLQDFPVLEHVDTLSANKNEFKDLDMFMELCKVKLPKLTNLSLLKNPICPFVIGEIEYYNYRIQVTNKLPNLVILDGFEVSMNDTFMPQVEDDYDYNQKQDEVNLDGEAKGTIEYNKKYSKQRNQTIKDNSEGNRFIRSDQL